MQINKDIIKKYSSENNGFTPIVFYFDGQYYSSKHTNTKIHGNKKCHDFKLSLPGITSITHSVVTKYNFYFQTNGSQKAMKYHSRYSYNNAERVIEKVDCFDCYLIIAKYKSDFTENYYIYHNFQLKYEICDVKFINLRPFDFDGNNFMFSRQRYQDKEEFFYMYQGKEYAEKKLTCSLAEWCRSYNPSMEKMYSLKNPRSIEDISWKSKDIVEWVCSEGHAYMASVVSKTKGLFRESDCPICREKWNKERSEKFIESQQKEDEKIRGLLKRYNTSSIAIAYEKLILDLENAYKKAVQNPGWLSPQETWSKFASGTFSYPKGKQGEINMFLASEFGEVEEIAPQTYEVKISTVHLDIIELLSEYGIGICDFARQANTIFALCTYRDDFLTLYRALEWRENQYNDYLNLYKKTAEIVSDYFQKIRKRRDRVYGDIVAQGKLHIKWKSEQLAFSLIKSAYADAVYQYKADWLDYQSLDIYIPSLRIAIEYQGKQHYSSVEYFGGKIGLEYRMRLDEIKKERCYAHGIKLIEWRYDDPLTLAFIKEKIEAV